MADESHPIRVRSFVGRSFDPSDEGVWFEIRKVLESLRPLGLVFEDAQEAQLRPISEKVRQGIERNDVYIGILTRRRPVEGARPTANAVRRLLDALRKPASPSQWTSSEWVVQESGFALGRGKQVILMIEQGVVYPTADLDADTEWIPFDRTSVPDCSLRLVQMINNLIAEKLPIVAAQVLVAPPPGDGTTEEKPEEAPGRVDEFDRVMTLLKQKQFTEADQVFTAYLTAQPEGTFKQWLPYFYLRQKYFKGDPDSLPKLKDAVLHEPENFYARAELARCYRSFKAYKEAARVLLEGADIVPARFKPQMLLRLTPVGLVETVRAWAGRSIRRTCGTSADASPHRRPASNT